MTDLVPGWPERHIRRERSEPGPEFYCTQCRFVRYPLVEQSDGRKLCTRCLRQTKRPLATCPECGYQVESILDGPGGQRACNRCIGRRLDRIRHRGGQLPITEGNHA